MGRWGSELGRKMGAIENISDAHAAEISGRGNSADAGPESRADISPLGRSKYGGLKSALLKKRRLLYAKAWRSIAMLLGTAVLGSSLPSISRETQPV